METINKIIVWDLPGGGVAITTFQKSKIAASGISEDAYIQREIAKLKRDHPGTFSTYSEATKSDIPQGREGREKWRIKNGKIAADLTIKTERESLNEKKDSVKAKIKALGLTDEETAILVK